jgi:hypothetical protein
MLSASLKGGHDAFVDRDKRALQQFLSNCKFIKHETDTT